MTKPTREEAEQAVRTLIRWAGDDPLREGLEDTPSRVVRSYGEFFAGYDQDPAEMLRTSFEEDVKTYDEMVVLTDIRVESYCEHHMVPIIGTAVVGYLPKGRVVGISKLARVIDAFAKRLQIQEKLTRQIADTLQQELECYGCGVIIKAQHQCMTTRGVHKTDVKMVSSALTGVFKKNPTVRAEFLAYAHG